ncbi:hypothetical protein A5646_03100 [Mycobacterium sp. 1245499.0]|nr:hypothetical protein A5646_03100 [Mycobacterium sp. 1245499.0]
MPPSWYSVASRLPGALSVVITSNRLSCACGGRYINRPSALQALGRDSSKPLSRRAPRQSSRRSTDTVRSCAVGLAPNAPSVVDLNSMTAGWSTSYTTVPAGQARR